MLEKELRVTDKLGLHARPSALLAKTAQQFTSAITISHAGRTVDAKSILNLMTLALPLDSVFTLRVDGGDEQAAFEAIKDLFANRFGESE